jgi:hypothetical protein
VTPRLGRWLREILISIDQLLHVLRGGPVPGADEAISSKVGWRAIAGALGADRRVGDRLAVRATG